MIPLANYIRRLTALIFDLLFLYFLVKMLFWGFKNEMMENAELAHWLERIAFMGYFVLGASSLADGRTLGKLVMGIRVTDYEGKLLNVGQALVRTVALFPGMVFSFFLADLIFSQESYANEIIYKPGIAMGINLSLFLATTFAIAFNPFRQGIHDYWCKTVVRPVGAPTLSMDEIKGLIGGNVEQLQRQPQLMAMGTFVLIFGLMCWQLVQPKIDPAELKQFEFQNKVLAEAKIDHSTLSAGFAPNIPLNIETNTPFTQDQVNAFIADISDEASTETVRLLMALRVEGRATFDKNQDELFMNFAEQFRDEILSTTPPEFRYGGANIKITNFRQRPMVVQFLILEGYNIWNSIPADTGIDPESKKSFTFDFPPLSAKMDKTKGADTE